jgi:hypothetical protein
MDDDTNNEYTLRPDSPTLRPDSLSKTDSYVQKKDYFKKNLKNSNDADSEDEQNLLKVKKHPINNTRKKNIQPNKINLPDSLSNTPLYKLFVKVVNSNDFASLINNYKNNKPIRNAFSNAAIVLVKIMMDDIVSNNNQQNQSNLENFAQYLNEALKKIGIYNKINIDIINQKNGLIDINDDNEDECKFYLKQSVEAYNEIWNLMPKKIKRELENDGFYLENDEYQEVGVISWFHEKFQKKEESSEDDGNHGDKSNSNNNENTHNGNDSVLKCFQESFFKNNDEKF